MILQICKLFAFLAIAKKALDTMDPFTPLFHELTEPLMRLQANGTQFRIILWTARNSYGWSGAKFTFFSWSKIAKDIRTSRTSVSREGRILLTKKILHLNEKGNIGINKKEIVRVCGSAQVSDLAQCGLDTHTVSKSIRSFPIVKKERNILSNKELDESFNDFYRHYPKHQQKVAALKAWTRLKPSVELRASILAGVERWKQSKQWEDYQFIPLPASFLNGRRWEDEVKVEAELHESRYA